ncbi:hypothetical protein SELMODRAFT_417420 [Selaginella moellendorffii]|uniref:Uncharacterized protein n=1 Tax=Selaginella moellendorffii TaxID=88036 RepID=D8S257_SELML|nr:hypothetical protein SELMODRAFT_417420 [Selaginella moellendorffii]
MACIMAEFCMGIKLKESVVNLGEIRELVKIMDDHVPLVTAQGDNFHTEIYAPVKQDQDLHSLLGNLKDELPDLIDFMEASPNLDASASRPLPFPDSRNSTVFGEVPAGIQGQAQAQLRMLTLMFQRKAFLQESNLNDLVTSSTGRRQ